jgi:very-short-patch-repair endonuclease
MKKEKYLQIFNYLLEFSKIRSKAVRDINNAKTQYIEKIWLSDIPKNDLIDCILEDDFNKDADYWIKISKPIEPESPEFPQPPENLKNWIVENSIQKDDFPISKEYILTDDNNDKIYLEDNPNIKKDFDEYLENKWFKDSARYWEEYKNYEILFKAYNEVNLIYKKLFSIYNKSQQFGEEFEFILGLGLINFKENDESPPICRHVLTYGAEITFKYSQRDSSILISPNLTTDIQIETDAIIDLFEQFDSNNIIDAERKALNFVKDNNLETSPFDKRNKETIQIIADRFRPDGLFKDELTKPNDIPQKPTIVYAPALILRKRNTRSFTALYEKIIKDIKNNNDINIPTLDDIIELNENYPNNEDSSNINNKNDTIYFPKEHNDEQIEIIEKAKRNNKVLVQGPPGTGKSHTIANLICHFLANGKKILITAYTKRALDVLKQKLPDEFKSLTINLLGGDSSSIQELEANVNIINAKLSNPNLSNYQEKIDRYEKELLSLKENRAFKTNEFLKIKEQATRKQEINEHYQGLLIDIAQKLENDNVKYNWFKDEYYDINNVELTKKVENFIELIQYYHQLDCKEFDYKIPDKSELFTTSEFKKYVETKTYLSNNNISLNSAASVKCKDYFKTKELLNSLYKLCLSIEKKKHTKIATIVIDIKKNNIAWENRIKESKKILDNLGKINLKSLDMSMEIRYPQGKSLITLKNDANKLLHYLKSGNKLSGVSFNLKKTFMPQKIKEKLYFIDSVRVNGSPCDTTWEFSSVIEDIRIRQLFQELAEIWDVNIRNLSKKYSNFFDVFFQKQSDTIDFVNNLSKANRLAKEIRNYSSINIQNFESITIRKYIKDIKKNYLIKIFKDFNKHKDQIYFYLSNDDFHPIATIIKNTISEFNIFKFEQLLGKLENLKSKKKQFDDFKKTEKELKSFLPFLIRDIIDSTFDNNNIHSLNKAIHFKHAKKEVHKLLDEDYENKLNSDLFSYDKKEKKLISKVAAQKAWIHVLTKLQQNRILHQHLKAWVQAVTKSEQGKRALKFRKEAQRQMEHCKTTVPCWIMPLYKVVETISPEQDMYDYVIIDEASQLGPDAIFLLYISKNIIIVGDDKQTSPEYVGVPAGIMAPFIKKLLKGIPFAIFFDTEFSFFDHAKRFCEGFIFLREHFRCMPEIIEFSNKYFYAPEGKALYPLKQYSENRLNPLEHIFCQSGFVEGRYQNIRNKVEAEKIVAKISELIKDKVYNEKTFGVICLQGNAQASLIENLLLQKIGEKQFKERKIVCGNSTSFQGDERDIIFLSLVTAHNHPRRALTGLKDEQRFNVAVSRAIEQIWLFHSIQMEDLSNTNDLRYKLLDHFVNYKNVQTGWSNLIPVPKVKEKSKQPSPFRSWFEVEVYNDIVCKGFKVIPAYKVVKNKYEIDLVPVLPNEIKIAVECDGDKWHGAEQYQNDLMRQKVLERCGWQFFRVRGGEYYSNRIKALEPLWEILKERQNHQTAEPIVKKKDEIKDDDISTNNRNRVRNKRTKIKKANKNQGSLFDNNFEQSNVTTKPVIKHHLQNISKSANENKSGGQSEILVFTNKCNVYKIKNKHFYSKQHILDTIKFDKNEKSIYRTNTSDFCGYMLFGFENGKVAKIFIESYNTETQRKKLKNAYNNNSKLVFVDYVKEDVELVAISSIKKVLLFNTAQINPKESRTSQGNQVMRPKNDSIMQKIKKVNQVNFNNIEYYRKNVPATGNYLLPGDRI